MESSDCYNELLLCHSLVHPVILMGTATISFTERQQTDAEIETQNRNSK